MESHAGEGHCHEGGEGRGFEETAVGWLEFVEAGEGSAFDRVAKEARDWIF